MLYIKKYIKSLILISVGAMISTALAPSIPGADDDARITCETGSSSSNEPISSERNPSSSEPENIKLNTDTQIRVEETPSNYYTESTDPVFTEIVALVEHMLSEDKKQYFFKLIESIQSSKDMPDLEKHMLKPIDTESYLRRSIAFCLQDWRILIGPLKNADLLKKKNINIGCVRDLLYEYDFIYKKSEIEESCRKLYRKMCGIQHLINYFYNNREALESLLNQMRGVSQDWLILHHISIHMRSIDTNLSEEIKSKPICYSFRQLCLEIERIMAMQERVINSLCAYVQGCDRKDIEKILFPHNP